MTLAPQRRWSFSLRTLLLTMTVSAVLLAVAGLKIRQDTNRQAAMSALHAMGMQISISSLAGGGTALTLTCESGNFSDDQIESLIGQIAVLNRPYDLGLSEGMDLMQLDLAKSRVTSDGERSLRRAFPNVEITR